MAKYGKMITKIANAADVHPRTVYDLGRQLHQGKRFNRKLENEMRPSLYVKHSYCSVCKIWYWKSRHRSMFCDKCGKRLRMNVRGSPGRQIKNQKVKRY